MRKVIMIPNAVYELTSPISFKEISLAERVKSPPLVTAEPFTSYDSE